MLGLLINSIRKTSNRGEKFKMGIYYMTAEQKFQNETGYDIYGNKVSSTSNTKKRRR